mgnify:CR=1 FL=1
MFFERWTFVILEAFIKACNLFFVAPTFWIIYAFVEAALMSKWKYHPFLKIKMVKGSFWIDALLEDRIKGTRLNSTHRHCRAGLTAAAGGGGVTCISRDRPECKSRWHFPALYSDIHFYYFPAELHHHTRTFAPNRGFSIQENVLSYFL